MPRPIFDRAIFDRAICFEKELELMSRPRYFTGRDVTEKQTNYISVLKSKHGLPDWLFEQHCQNRFGQPYTDLTRIQVSSLIDEMSGWDALPAELQRLKGQLDLFGEVA
jgi:hypothetical protein